MAEYTQCTGKNCHCQGPHKVNVKNRILLYAMAIPGVGIAIHLFIHFITMIFGISCPMGF